MKKSQVILGLKNPRLFTREERISVIEEYLSSGLTKKEIWYKYTGQVEEKGRLLVWMYKLGYKVISQKCNFVVNKTISMSKKTPKLDVENFELKRRISNLEKALVNSELKALAYDTMIDVAEKELKISIRKKSNTKQLN